MEFNRAARTLFASALLIATLAGCSNPAANLVGKWKGKIDMSKETAKKGDPSAAMVEAMGKAFFSNLTLELKADKSFSMMMVMFPIEGKWSVDGDTVTLTAEKVMGMSKDQFKSQANKQSGSTSMSGDMDKPIKLKMSPDGKTLTWEKDKPSEGQMVFEKEKS